VAAPFVEGRLLNRKLLVRIATACAHCGRALDLDIDSELNWKVRQRGAQPLVFEPDIDWSTFRQTSIIHDY
jgi:hypothetical protein